MSKPNFTKVSFPTHPTSPYDSIGVANKRFGLDTINQVMTNESFHTDEVVRWKIKIGCLPDSPFFKKWFAEITDGKPDLNDDIKTKMIVKLYFGEIKQTETEEALGESTIISRPKKLNESRKKFDEIVFRACNECQVRNACVISAMATDDKSGVRGGLTPGQRTNFLNEHPKIANIFSKYQTKIQKYFISS